jgi:GDPmannose 4,6-dehydratase
MKKALITGVTGQDGSYLAELLLSKNYEVHGVVRRTSNFNTQRIDHIYQDPHSNHQHFHLHYGDLSDTSVISNLVESIAPDEIYNLAAQSHVKVSFELPEYTGNVVGLGTLRMLEAIRRFNPKIKFYQASSSEMFGKVVETPQTEATPFHPRSPYGVAKVYAHWITVNYRESYDLFACSGILFNHESPRRGKTFVTRKVTRGLARIKLGLDETLFLGNLDAKRDWGFAGDYVEAMHLMLQQDKAEDYVIATGQTHSAREFVEKAAQQFGFVIEWQGKGLDEVGIDKHTGKELIKIDAKYFRPAEVDLLLGSSDKAKQKLNWQPKTTFDQLITMMCESDLRMEQNNEQRF